MSASSSPPQQRVRCNEMVLFDIETNIFPIEVIEFGAIIVDKFVSLERKKIDRDQPFFFLLTSISLCVLQSYVELERRHTMIQPLSGSISARATDIHGISFEDLQESPLFAAVAPMLFGALDGRVWCGHNINSFDVPQLTKAFVAASHPVPVPCATLDTLPLVRRIFGKRAGDCKMATLGRYFGLGTEKHRAIDDCEMTLAALKCIGLHNLLEREMPSTFPKFTAPVVSAAAAVANVVPIVAATAVIAVDQTK